MEAGSSLRAEPGGASLGGNNCSFYRGLTVCQYCTNHLTHTHSSCQSSEIYTIIFPVFQMRKLGHSQVGGLAQGHTSLAELCLEYRHPDPEKRGGRTQGGGPGSPLLSCWEFVSFIRTCTGTSVLRKLCFIS